MNTYRIQLSRMAQALIMVGAALACTPALATGKTSLVEMQARYQRERAVCMSDRPIDDRAICLQEASTALAAAKRGSLDDDPATPYASNALRRCERLADEDRRDCLMRMRGRGTTSGSVTGGGIYRELVTREVTPPSAVVPEADGQIAPAK